MRVITDAFDPCQCTKFHPNYIIQSLRNNWIWNSNRKAPLIWPHGHTDICSMMRGKKLRDEKDIGDGTCGVLGSYNVVTWATSTPSQHNWLQILCWKLHEEDILQQGVIDVILHILTYCLHDRQGLRTFLKKKTPLDQSECLKWESFVNWDQNFSKVSHFRVSVSVYVLVLVVQYVKMCGIASFPVQYYDTSHPDVQLPTRPCCNSKTIVFWWCQSHLLLS